MRSSIRGIAFLDRDGTLIETDVEGGKPIAINDVSRVQLVPGVRNGCAELRDHGFLLVMVTNQPDVARGVVSRETVQVVNEEIRGELDLDMVLACLHDDSDHCPCRKPAAGMLFEAAERTHMKLGLESVIFGDRWKDIEAGRRAGVSSVLFEGCYVETTECHPSFKCSVFENGVAWAVENMERRLSK